MRRAVLLAAVLVLGACSADEPTGNRERRDEKQETTSTSTTVAAELDLEVRLAWFFTPLDGSGIMRDDAGEGIPCGTSDLTDPDDLLAFMVPGGEVLLRDEANKVVAQGELPVGETANPDEEALTYYCVWTVDFGAVPVADFYQVEVAGVEVGTLSRAEAGKAQPTIDIRL